MLPSNPSSPRARVRPMLPALAVVAIVSATLLVTGVAFYARSTSIMEQQLKDKLQSTAGAAAMQFLGEDIDAVPDGATLGSSEALRKLTGRLRVLRDTVTNIRFTYIMRRTDDPLIHEFVADADMGRSLEELDGNGNGTLDSDEVPPDVGEPYEWGEFPVLGEEAFLRPSVDEEIGEDQWGLLISGYAPIRRRDGSVAGILGIDMDAKDYIELSRSIFSPMVLLLVLVGVLTVSVSAVLFLWRRRVDMLERLEMERTGLLRLAFHQLGGPLTIISWSLEELEEEGPTSLQRTITNIEEGVKRLTAILKTLKDADVVHAGRLEYKPAPASLTSILQHVVKEASAKLAVRKQHLELDLSENVTMNLDQKLIEGVAQELLQNAIDFSPDGGRIAIRSKAAGRFAEFSVQDFGCGIPKKDLSRIFSEFARGSNATKYKADGNGLGLYIVHGIIERAGGTVTVESEEGRGTTVTVRLPVA